MSNTSSALSGGGGGGMRELGTVTGGMAIRHFDDRTRPYNRADFIDFLRHYDTNLDEQELRLVKTGLAVTLLSFPLSFAVGYYGARRLPWSKFVYHVSTYSGGGAPGKWMLRVPTLGRVSFGMCTMSIAYAVVQQWFVTRVLDLDEHTSALSFHVRRMMLTQRSSLMFTRTATREVTREEQQRLLRESEAVVNENRSGQRVHSGLATGPVDVNLKLGQQMLTPVAQTGYKPIS